MDYHPMVYLNKLQTHGRKKQSVVYRRERFDLFDSLYCQNLAAHYGCVNALEFSNIAGHYLASGGDDKRVLLWNINHAIQKPTYQPVQMKATHLSNIFCLAFSRSDDRLMSSGNDGQIIVHDLGTNVLADVFVCDASVYGLSANPVNEYQIAAACEDGTIHILDTRLPKADGICLAKRYTAFHSVTFSPVDHHLIATAHSWDGMALWDIRSPKKEVLHYGQKRSKQRAMSARFNKTGNQLLLLRRRQPMALFNINDSESVFEFDAEGYCNACTMKSCCFAGDKDQYIVSGSDDFGVYVWKIPEDSLQDKLIGRPSKILHGHRSIVNQVRFNPLTNMLVSCGVEKMVKLWCTERLPHSREDTKDRTEAPRKRYSHTEYIELILESSSMAHDYHAENTEEDPKMLAFFDSLLQHENEETGSEQSDDDSVASGDRPFLAVASEEVSLSGSGDDESDDVRAGRTGDAFLGPLEAGGQGLEVTVIPDETKTRLKKLRATVKEDNNNVGISDSTQDALTTRDESKKQFDTPKTKRRKKDFSIAASRSSSDSDDNSTASRTRQRNARRRPRRASRDRFRCPDDSEPSTSGFNSKSDSTGTSFVKKHPPSR